MEEDVKNSRAFVGSDIAGHEIWKRVVHLPGPARRITRPIQDTNIFWGADTYLLGEHIAATLICGRGVFTAMPMMSLKTSNSIIQDTEYLLPKQTMRACPIYLFLLY